MRENRAYLAYWLPWSPVWRAGAAERLHDRLHQGHRLFPRSDALRPQRRIL